MEKFSLKNQPIDEPLFAKFKHDVSLVLRNFKLSTDDLSLYCDTWFEDNGRPDLFTRVLINGSDSYSITIGQPVATTEHPIKHLS